MRSEGDLSAHRIPPLSDSVRDRFLLNAGSLVPGLRRKSASARNDERESAELLRACISPLLAVTTMGDKLSCGEHTHDPSEPS